MDEAVELLLQQSDDYLRYECTALLLDLARLSNTTQMPASLEREWQRVTDGFPQIVDQLKAWYRRY
jgi:hypothetical protein